MDPTLSCCTGLMKFPRVLIATKGMPRLPILLEKALLIRGPREKLLAAPVITLWEALMILL